MLKVCALFLMELLQKHKNLSSISEMQLKSLWTINFNYLIYYSYLLCLQCDLLGQSLLEIVFARLNLIETAYFGLRFLDVEGQTVNIAFDFYRFIEN